MRRLRLFFINHFGFSKVEANASILLIIFIFCFAVAPRIWLSQHSFGQQSPAADSLDLAAWHADIMQSLAFKSDSRSKTQEPFSFNPNDAKIEDLVALGFENHIARRIHKYRAAGGEFRKASDLEKIYGVDKALLAALRDYIVLPPPEVMVDEEIKKKAPTNVEKSTKEHVPEIKTVFLNQATAETLQSIDGIGPTYAQRIVNYREALGGFTSFEQLREIYRIRPEAIDAVIKNSQMVDPPRKTIPINSDSIKHIARHPYMSWNQAKAIYYYRLSHGAFEDPAEIKAIKIISDSLYQKISPYLSVEP